MAGFTQSVVSDDEKALASFLSLINRPDEKIICNTDDSEQTYILEDALKQCDVYDEELTRAVKFLQSSEIVDSLLKVNQLLPGCKFIVCLMKFSSEIRSHSRLFKTCYFRPKHSTKFVLLIQKNIN